MKRLRLFIAKMLNDSEREWALNFFRQSLQTSRFSQSLQEVTISSDAPAGLPTDPEKLEYLRDLIQYILNGRTIVASYNIVLLLMLLFFAFFHICQRAKEGRRWRAIEGGQSDGVDAVTKAVEDGENGAESSSSSTLEGSLPSETNLKHANSDLERQPLLGNRQHGLHSTLPRPYKFAVIRSWLIYQPRPIPLINRALPSNGTSLFVAAYITLNVFYQLFRLPFELRHFFAFADRAGYLFVVNLPLLYLLAAKNQPLKLLTGRSYEALNIYHRRVGELMCFEAFVHFASMLIWRVWIEPEWLHRADQSIWLYLTHPLVLLGIGAFLSYELLYFTSLASFRERWYELFLASHVLLQVAGLAFLWLHFFTSRPYIYASLAIFLLDRIVWRIGLKSASVTANIEVLEDGETVLLSANWDILQPQRQKALRPLCRNILHGWHPADHVFISIPSLGGSGALQAHPFTIASAASAPGVIPAHAWLNLLIRAQSGFTLDLLRHARLNTTVSLRIDGPYGTREPLDMLRASTTAVLVAGGSGIAVVFPLVWELAKVHRGKRMIHLLWIIHSRSQRSWIPLDRIDELRQAGVRITIPDPTAEVGRPDVPAYIAEVAASQSDIGVVVSGPDGLNRSVRNACALEIQSGADIDLRVEKFGW
ncbi:hypothetical protein F5Y19DRAFT_112711 [Xylariaceae sp. FL1651]|nr:hypothetical protein F5Y19DRAFT_112711 [Xylariaceae sp. FL1651]